MDLSVHVELFSNCPHLLQSRAWAGGCHLQHKFIQHLMKHLEELEGRAERVEEVYSVLALVPWSSPSGDGQLEVLCEALWAARDGPLNEERVLGALLRPRCDTLVSVYCSTAVRLQRDRLLRSAPGTQGRRPNMELFRACA